MSDGHFVLIKKEKISEMVVGSQIPSSDYATISPTGEFVQFKYVEDNKKVTPTIVEPGIWSITPETGSLTLYKTEFSKENILSSFSHTEMISRKINSFFSKLDIYKKYGIEVPKRGMLLYGPAGTGKTSSLKFVANSHVSDGKTAVLLWPTDKVGAHDVKELTKSFEYKGVEKLILIAEDLGGVEVEEVKMESRSSLLALLDNQEKTFKIPTLILATTNHPEVFNGNLTNRPGRFSDKIEVGFPNASARKELFKFYLKEKVTDELLETITQKKYEEFTPAHIQEVLLRSELYDLTIEDTVEEIAQEIKKYKTMFKDKRVIGINEDYYE